MLGEDRDHTDVARQHVRMSLGTVQLVLKQKERIMVYSTLLKGQHDVEEP